MERPIVEVTAADERVQQFLRRCLVIDLEVSLSDRLLAWGAVLGEVTRHGQGDVSHGSGEDLAALARDAAVVVGHNLVAHDLPHLRRFAPGHPIHRLPVVDTLLLSPLAFPQNPYHHLVKDYKLVRQSVSDPVADARLALELLGDELRAFARLAATDPLLLAALRSLLCGDGANDPLAAGHRALFDVLPASSLPPSSMLSSLAGWLDGKACRDAAVARPALASLQDRLALAYALAWLSVAGRDSVLPRWVRSTHPGAIALIRQWREVNCGAAECRYCHETFDARAQLRRFFSFPDFRSQPSSPAGGSLQQAIVESGLRDESLLAILPTGGGKSLCFQLPALVRNYRRGVLTVVISPLQALMKDQVDNLHRRAGITSAAALYGLLTPPERGAVLRRVAAGDIALLYVSPEQLRNRSFEETLAMREVGCWVFDEAHCLSKWGHDFRPDYLYAARFIRELARRQGVEVPAIACFTATARREVTEEILRHFRSETGRELRLFEGGIDRDNLRFAVESMGGSSKVHRVHEILAGHLSPGGAGAAVVFRSRRKAAEAMAEALGRFGWSAGHFHAGLAAPEKKRIQDEFLAGRLQVICATNAFGMGIDKEDVRVVVHADTPGSLENYLQEAGRAGRDGGQADCVLLFDDADCEDQFRLGARSELERRDLAAILRTLRRRARGERHEVVLTVGEILRDDSFDDSSLALQEGTGDTQVRTAIAWLERAGFIQRDENVTSVFQAQLVVRNLAEADARMAGLGLSDHERGLWRSILVLLMNTPPTDTLTVDRIAQLREFADLKLPVRNGLPAGPEELSARIRRILYSMAKAGLVRRDTRMNAYLRYKVADHSQVRLDRITRAENRLIDLLAETDPDPQEWVPLLLRPVNQRLLDEGFESSPELLRNLLRSLGEDGRGLAGNHGSIELKALGADHYRLRLGRSWSCVHDLARKRQRVASIVLRTLLGKVAADQPARADVLVEFGFEELLTALDADALLRSDLRDPEAALERALLHLHEHRVLVLQQGLAIFRSAMTLRLRPERREDRYRSADYQPLRDHYRERTLQVHVMAEYARRGLQRIQDALTLVRGYFDLRREEFVTRFFRQRTELLEYATTAQSFHRIVTDLGNREQIRIVTAPLDRNLLVLAGPGSGKTRTVVHRCAYLLRVKRVPPRSILICCFNRHAAHELRRRLRDLVGEEAGGVLVQTYHGLALRLLGRSLATTTGRGGERPDFERLIQDAVALLEGRSPAAGMEPDEVRDRLLAGFRHILVDEYQDIDEDQYALISALAGRSLEDDDQRLSLLAVGDDDQNIYAFRGSSVRFIRRFESDYHAKTHYLVENYRATRYLIEAANQFISGAAERMKVDHPIRIDAARELVPPGGIHGCKDPLTGGRVQRINVPDRAAQTAAVIDEIRRRRTLGVTSDSSFAVLAETHQDLATIRAAFEQEGWPFRWMAYRASIPLEQVREVRSVLDRLLAEGHRELTIEALESWVRSVPLPEGRNHPWNDFLLQQCTAWRLESETAARPASELREALLEACIESRRLPAGGQGIALGTVHAAKGTEFPHVLLVGRWALHGHHDEAEDLRRVFYVGMTRARESLTIIRRSAGGPALGDDLHGPAIQPFSRPAEAPGSALPPPAYHETSLEDLDLGFAGRYPEGHVIHGLLAALLPGSILRLRPGGAVGDWRLTTPEGVPVARMSRQWVRLSGAWAGRVREARVVAMIRRTTRQDQDAARRARCRVDEWEVPLVEFVSAATG